MKYADSFADNINEISEWAQRESNGDLRNGTDENRENGTRFSVNDKPYYLVPFADSVDAVINAENQKKQLSN